MDFESELKRFAETYVDQGYEVTIHPKREDLPEFARDFRIELMGKRGSQGILASIKRDREEFASDPHLPAYAEITNKQSGWRYDFAILGESKPNVKEIDGASDFSEHDIENSFVESLKMAELGFARPAVMTAWAAFEAATRLRLRAAGEEAGWGSSPGSMLTELYSNGLLGESEFRRLQMLFRVRNQIAHGFLSPLATDDAVRFLCRIGRHLVDESKKSSILI